MTARIDTVDRPRSIAFITVLHLLLVGCATFDPPPLDEALFYQRAEIQHGDRVSVRVALPSREETRRIFGVDLYQGGIQPVWIAIDNRNEAPVWFLPVGMDPLYFTPLEASFLSHFRFSKASNEKMDRHFFDKGKDIYVHPKSKRSGFVFTNLDEGTKSVSVDLVVGDQQTQTFTFFIPVPGLRIDHRTIDFHSLYPAQQWQTFEAEGDLIAYLASLPCCTTDSRGKGTGDPLNLIVIGDGEDVYHAFMRAGWDETETVTAASAWKTVRSFFFKGRYRYSPVSPLYLFGRRQDAALQKVRESIHERNHLRLWLTPVTYKGQLVWVGQISRDIGVRFSARTIVTHKIDPDVDETRGYLIQNLWYTQGLSQFAFVKGVGVAPFEKPRENLTGDPYFTDGLRAALWVSSQPVAFEAVNYLEWESLE